MMLLLHKLIFHLDQHSVKDICCLCFHWWQAEPRVVVRKTIFVDEGVVVVGVISR